MKDRQTDARINGVLVNAGIGATYTAGGDLAWVYADHVTFLPLFFFHCPVSLFHPFPFPSGLLFFPSTLKFG